MDSSTGLLVCGPLSSRCLEHRPAAWRYIVSIWALLRLIQVNFAQGIASANAVPWVSMVLISLAALMLVEAFKVFFAGVRPPRAPEPAPVAG